MHLLFLFYFSDSAVNFLTSWEHRPENGILRQFVSALASLLFEMSLGLLDSKLGGMDNNLGFFQRFDNWLEPDKVF